MKLSKVRDSRSLNPTRCCPAERCGAQENSGLESRLLSPPAMCSPERWARDCRFGGTSGPGQLLPSILRCEYSENTCKQEERAQWNEGACGMANGASVSRSASGCMLALKYFNTTMRRGKRSRGEEKLTNVLWSRLCHSVLAMFFSTATYP